MKSLDQRVIELMGDVELLNDRLDEMKEIYFTLNDVVGELMDFCGYEEKPDGAAA